MTGALCHLSLATQPCTACQQDDLLTCLLLLLLANPYSIAEVLHDRKFFTSALQVLAEARRMWRHPLQPATEAWIAELAASAAAQAAPAKVEQEPPPPPPPPSFETTAIVVFRGKYMDDKASLAQFCWDAMG